ncbi:MAG: hypothetical protein ACQEWV_27015 [Bacillota bacterium]
MEFLMIFSIHFFIMGSIVMLFSGIISFALKRVHFIVIVLLTMLAGVIYAIVYEISELGLMAAIFNGILSLLAIGLVKLGLYAGRKAEEMDK